MKYFLNIQISLRINKNFNKSFIKRLHHFVKAYIADLYIGTTTNSEGQDQPSQFEEASDKQDKIVKIIPRLNVTG